MDLRQLRYFVAVAEELHFSRAAARLSLAQSALSSQIRRLEAEIGGPLLDRSTRRVALTPAGASLYEDARELLHVAERALERAQGLARGEIGALRVGVLGPAPGGVLAALLSMFGERHPDVRVEVRSLDFVQMLDELRSDDVDVVFTYPPLDEPDIELLPLMLEERVVALPSHHRLASRDVLRPVDVRGEMFVTQPDAVPESWRDFWMLVEENGERPPVSPRRGASVEAWLTLIGHGEGIDTCPAVMSRYYAWPEVTYVPLVDARPATLVLARRRDDTSALVADFVAEAHAIADTFSHAAGTPYAPAG